jgi:succinate dehydrogenase / fumarate reductase membrane anchor subunit
MTTYRTPLARVRGLGAAKHGVGDFIVQRVSGAALVLLLLWGVVSIVPLARGGFDVAARWLHAPLNAAGLALIVVVAVIHMQIGMREIIIDYIERTATKAALLVLNTFIAWFAGALGVLSVIIVAMGSR